MVLSLIPDSDSGTSGMELWVLRSTLNVKATDTTLAPGEGISSDHTFRPRHQQREIHSDSDAIRESASKRKNAKMAIIA